METREKGLAVDFSNTVMRSGDAETFVLKDVSFHFNVQWLNTSLPLHSDVLECVEEIFLRQL